MKLSLNINGKSYGFAFGKSVTQDFLRANDVDDSAGAKLSQPYQQSAWVYTAVSIIAAQVASLPLRVCRTDEANARKIRARRTSASGKQRAFARREMEDNLIESGPVVDLLNQPHPTMDRQMFFDQVVTWLMLRGEFFLVPLDQSDSPAEGKAIKRLLTLNPDMFWHIVQGYELAGWRYTGSPLQSPLPSQILLPREVIHSRTPNPYLFWRGLSPLSVAMVPSSTDYAGEQFQKGLWLNNADTGVVVTTDQSPSADQREAIRAALLERKRKAGTADRPLFLFGGAKIEKPTLSMMDMQYLETRKFLMQEIFAIFKVPPALAGFTADLNDGGAGGSLDATKISFIESTVGGICHRIEAALQPVIEALQPGCICWFDIDSLPIMQAARRSRVDTAVKAFGIGAAFNDVNEVYDLGFPEYDWGHKSFLPFSLQEVGGEVEAPEAEDNTEDTEDSNPVDKLLKFVKGLKAIAPAPHVCAPPQGFEEAIAGSVKQKSVTLSRFFFEQRSRVLAALENYNKAVKGIESVFNADAENSFLLQKMNPLLRLDLQFGGAQIYTEVGNSDMFNLPPKEALAFLAKRAKPIKDINATTWDKLQGTLREGIEAGESTAELAARVRATYNSITSGRANVIALTETQVAVNSGRQMAMEQAGIERKGWLTSHLENSRLSHIQNEQLSNAENGIPINEVWPNGCAYPGDPAGAPEEVINCRCVGFAINPDEPKAWQPVKFLNFAEWAKGATK